MTYNKEKIVISDEFLRAIVSNKQQVRRIYVCSPLSAKDTVGIKVNMLIVRDKCNVLNGLLKEHDIKAWAAHAYLPLILDDNIPAEREAAITFGISLLEMSDMLYVFGSKLSKGMKSEIDFAVTHNMDIAVEGNLKDEVMAYIDEFIGNQDMDGDA